MATAALPEPRKVTVFHWCERHARWGSDGRYRSAETFGEGGPGSGPPCTPGDPCKIRPGTDLMVADLCVQRDWYLTTEGDHHFRWAVNEIPLPAWFAKHATPATP